MKSVLITGATGDLGRAIAEKFLKEDFFVFAHGSSEKSDFSFCEQNPEKTKKCIADFFDIPAIERMFSEIPTLDVLVNNAGIVFREKEISPERFEKVLRINTIAPYFCAEFARKKSVTSIVNIGSLRGFLESTTTPDYSASKAALHNLTASLARKYAPDVRVNAIAPGFIRTQMHAQNPERLALETKNIALKRIADPAEIAEFIFFVATKASYSTGEIFRADGGYGK